MLNLIPDEKRFGKRAAIEYSGKYMCYRIANNDMQRFHEIYYEEYMSDVWEYFGIKLAENHVRESAINSRA